MSGQLCNSYAACFAALGVKKRQESQSGKYRDVICTCEKKAVVGHKSKK